MRIYQKIWIKANGPIPSGHHIHHRDHDRSNNALDNLECLPCSEHQSYHARKRLAEGDPGMARGIAAAREAAKAWHASDVGRIWHREHALRVAAAQVPSEHVCVVCGTRYKTTKRKKGYCSMACQSKARRDSGIDNEIRQCAECGADFAVSRYKKTRFCSRSCGGKSAARLRLDRR